MVLPDLLHMHRVVHRGIGSRGVSGAGQTCGMTENGDGHGWPPIDPNDGWAELLAALREDLLRIDPRLVVRQIKQKGGVLDVWAETSGTELDDAVRERIAEAERQSAVTCERCGAPGQLHQRDNGWVRVECDVHSQPAHRWPACPWPGWALLYARLICDLVNIDEDLVVESVDVRDGELHVEVRGAGADRHDAAMARVADAEDQSLMTCVVCGEEADVPEDPVPPLCEEHR